MEMDIFWMASRVSYRVATEADALSRSSPSWPKAACCMVLLGLKGDWIRRSLICQGSFSDYFNYAALGPHVMRSCLLIPTLALAVNAIAVPPIANSDRSVLLTTSSGPTADLPACLRDGYYGVYGSVSEPDHVFISSEECVLGSEGALGNAFQSGSIVILDNAIRNQVLVWVGEAGVEQHLALGVSATDSIYETILDNLERLVGPEESSLFGDTDQHAFTIPGKFEKPILYHQSRHSMVLGVPEGTMGIIDRIVPGHLSLVAFPSQAYPLAFGQDSYGAPVPQYLIDNLVNITSGLKYSSKVDQVLDALDYRELVRSVRYLTGESGSGIVSRHSFSPGSRIAAKWIKGMSPLFVSAYLYLSLTFLRESRGHRRQMLLTTFPARLRTQRHLPLRSCLQSGRRTADDPIWSLRLSR